MSHQSFTRHELAVILHEARGMPMDEARATVELIITAMQEALTVGRKVEFRGFGVLEVIKRSSKIGRNPKKPEEGAYRIPARQVVKFRVGKNLDFALNIRRVAA